MLENLYTTKMSMDKKKLQKRFFKIRSENGRVSKFMAFIIFAVIIIVIACVSVIIAGRVNEKRSNEYAMTEAEFTEFVNRPVGAVMADIYYADDRKIVFHYNEGFFVDELTTEGIDYAINLKKLNIIYNQQGSSVIEVKVDSAGKYAYLSAAGPNDEIKDYDKYIINLDDGAVQKGTVPEDAELFTKTADTFATVQNPVGWFSNRCIVNEEKIYYLTSKNGMVNDIQLIIVNNSDAKEEIRYLFGGENVKNTQEIKIFSPEDIRDITDVELVAGGIKYPIVTKNAHIEIERVFSSAKMIGMGGTACSFGAELIFTRKDGEKGSVTIATDSCAVFKSGDVYYDYSDGDNSMLLGYFGVDARTLRDLIDYADKSYSESSEMAIRNFFGAFYKSDLATMKTLVTNEFIAKGYIGDYGMCSGMTKATLEDCSKTDNDKFLEFYFQKPEHTQFTLSDSDIELLKAESDEMEVYYVNVIAEHNIKGDTNPPFENNFYVICKKQGDKGYLVHKFVN